MSQHSRKSQSSPILGTQPPAEGKKLSLFDLIVAFLLPTLIGKSLVLYFGLHYSNEPGEGYGYGLALSILFTLSMVARFLWKYRNYKEDGAS